MCSLSAPYYNYEFVFKNTMAITIKYMMIKCRSKMKLACMYM